MSEQKLEAGDKVSHKGQWWYVRASFGGQVKIVSGIETKTVRVNEVVFLESLR